jgi:adenylate cyclase
MPGAHFWLGICLMRDGKVADAIVKFEQALRLYIRSPNNGSRYHTMGEALIFLEKYEEAISWLQRSLAANPSQGPNTRGNIHAVIAAAQALAGQHKKARLSAAEAIRFRPTLTALGYSRFDLTNPTYAAQVSRLRDGLRLAGIRDHADEDADFGVLSDDSLHTDCEAPTPTTVPGASTIRTADLALLLDQRRPMLVLDTGRAPIMSIPGAIGLWGAGIGGNLSDEFQDRLRLKMHQLTHGDHDLPLVTVAWNAERYQGRNLALRLVALGYAHVYWYRGGREAWVVNGHTQAELTQQEW